MRRNYAFLIALVVLMASAACNSSPTAPENMGGVTINGSLAAPGGANGSTHGAPASTGGPTTFVPPGLTVTAVGTNITATVDPSGQFVLRQLPSGNVQLLFTAAGTNATLTLSGLEAGQLVTIVVSLTSSSAAVASERRSGGREDQLEGLVQSLPPTTAALTLVVAGQAVTTDANTRFFLRGAPASFADLQIGQRVHVKGHVSGVSFLATVVMIQNSEGSALNLNGIISGFTGTRAAFEFMVNGQLVKGDANTEFFGNSQFNELADGMSVEVKGSQRDGFVHATRIHVNIEDIEVTGVIAGPITGTSPNLTFLVGGTTVKTSTETIVQRNGDMSQTPAQLQVGMTVELTGGLLPNGTVVAKRIHIVGDAVGGAFQMTGHMGGRSGTCPTIAFSVSGYAIATTGATIFVPNCSSLSNGSRVTVMGIVQAGGTVNATRVEKQ